MKRLSFIAALVLGALVACSSIANAQESKDKKGKGGGRPTVEQQVEEMTTALKLTDQQKPKVKAVLEDTSKRMREIFSEGNRDQMREKMRPIMEERTRKLKEILTSEQFEKWQKQQEERRSRFGKTKKSE